MKVRFKHILIILIWHSFKVLLKGKVYNSFIMCFLECEVLFFKLEITSFLKMILHDCRWFCFLIHNCSFKKIELFRMLTQVSKNLSKGFSVFRISIVGVINLCN